MAKAILKDVHVRNAKPRDKPYRLADGGNLYLHISPRGAKSWQLRYRLDGKPQTATLGKWPTISLAEARARADKARPLAESGAQLTVLKRETQAKRRTDASNTFATIKANWIAREARRARWTPDYRAEVEASLRNHLSPLDGLPVSKITAPVVAPHLRAIEFRAPHMLEKVKRRLHAILDYATEQGAIVGNPLPRTRASKIERRHFPAITDLSAIGEILRAARAADPCKGIQRGHVLLAFTAMRVTEVVGATWEEFELDGSDVPIGQTLRLRRDPNAGNWIIPRDRMKRKDAQRGPHVVPLPPLLLAQLRAWRDADQRSSPYVCPAPRDPKKHITPEAIEKSYRDALNLGGKHSPHSWRSAFSTVCRDHGKDPDVIEAQLDHVVGSKVASAYDRSKRLELRRNLMRWYEATLVAARDGAAVVNVDEARRRAHPPTDMTND